MDATLFPEIEPYRSGFLPVAEGHSLYYEEAGSPGGWPVLYLHGGPGGGISPLSRRFFDPTFYRIILFDQRGAGRSQPYAGLEHNTTPDLVADIERLRTRLNVPRWLVFGGSWGSTLALAYASVHPQRVVGLILRGVFLCRQSEIDWLYHQGASHVFPDGWEDFAGYIPAGERHDLLAAYYRRLTAADQDLQQQAAYHWCRWEAYIGRHDLDLTAVEEKLQDPRKLLALARIEAHYFVHHSFLEYDNYLLDRAPALDGIPTRIVQGRYDMVCPIRSAWELKRAMPHAGLHIVPDGGHSIRDQGIAAGLLEATQDFKNLFA